MRLEMGASAGSSSRGRDRLTTRVARMYYEQHLNQPQIADLLHVSQAKVSRLLKRAEQIGIVRVEVVSPAGSLPVMEEELVSKYGLSDAVIADTDGLAEHEIRDEVGAAAALYLGDTLLNHERIGVSPWSPTVLSMVTQLDRRPRSVADLVVQVVGGDSVSTVTQVQATQLTEELASVTGATPVFLNSPSVVSQPGLGQAILREPNVARIAAEWKTLTVLVAGIRAFDAAAPLDPADRISVEQQTVLREHKAVGGYCLRYFDEAGEAITVYDDQIVGIDRETMLGVPRRIAVSSGLHKTKAIQAAIRGGWINVLVTDLGTAESLLK